MSYLAVAESAAVEDSSDTESLGRSVNVVSYIFSVCCCCEEFAQPKSNERIRFGQHGDPVVARRRHDRSAHEEPRGGGDRQQRRFQGRPCRGQGQPDSALILCSRVAIITIRRLQYSETEIYRHVGYVVLHIIHTTTPHSSRVGMARMIHCDKNLHISVAVHEALIAFLIISVCRERLSFEILSPDS